MHEVHHAWCSSSVLAFINTRCYRIDIFLSYGPCWNAVKMASVSTPPPPKTILVCHNRWTLSFSRSTECWIDVLCRDQSQDPATCSFPADDSVANSSKTFEYMFYLTRLRSLGTGSVTFLSYSSISCTTYCSPFVGLGHVKTPARAKSRPYATRALHNRAEIALVR